MGVCRGEMYKGLIWVAWGISNPWTK